jgi:hypothetical protein
MLVANVADFCLQDDINILCHLLLSIGSERMAAMAARAIWKGSISFGLVNIPIQVFSATHKEDYTSFNQLCENGHKIKYKKWCPVEEREVQWSEIKKGCEVTKKHYVVIDKEDIDKVKLKTTNTDQDLTAAGKILWGWRLQDLI